MVNMGLNGGALAIAGGNPASLCLLRLGMSYKRASDILSQGAWATRMIRCRAF